MNSREKSYRSSGHIDHESFIRKQLIELNIQQEYRQLDVTELKKNKAMQKEPLYQKFINLIEDFNQKVKRLSHISISYAKIIEHIYYAIQKINLHRSKDTQNYLKQVNDWYERLVITPKNSFSIPKIKSNRKEETKIRQTYKSLLPSRIKNYKRKEYRGNKSQIIEPKQLSLNYEITKGKKLCKKQGNETISFDRFGCQSYRNQIKRLKENSFIKKQVDQFVMQIHKSKSRILQELLKNKQLSIQNENKIDYFKNTKQIHNSTTTALPSFKNKQKGLHAIKKTAKHKYHLDQESTIQLESIDGIKLLHNPLLLKKKKAFKNKQNSRM